MNADDNREALMVDALNAIVPNRPVSPDFMVRLLVHNRDAVLRALGMRERNDHLFNQRRWVSDWEDKADE